MDNIKPPAASGDIEKKLDELQGIVSKLENGSDITLEESMSLFERGLKITQQCVQDLDVLQSRIADINKQLDLVLCKPPFGDGDEN